MTTVKFDKTLHLQTMVKVMPAFHLKSVFKGIINLAIKIISNIKFSVRLPIPPLIGSTYSSN